MEERLIQLLEQVLVEANAGTFDFLELLAIIVTLLISIVGIIVSIRANKETRRQNKSDNELTKEQIRETQEQNRKDNELTQKQIAVSSVTDKRTEWISEVRDTVSQYTSRVTTLVGEWSAHLNEWSESHNIDRKSTRGRVEAINYFGDKLRLYLNFNGDIERVIANNDKRIRHEISNVLTYPDNNALREDAVKRIKQAVIDIHDHTRILLKLEWNRIRHEAECLKYSDEGDEYKKDKEKLIRDYYNTTPDIFTLNPNESESNDTQDL